MEEPFLPATGRTDAAAGAPEREMEALLRTYPGLEDLVPYYIEWEFIWPM
jgi:hypothetical protein